VFEAVLFLRHSPPKPTKNTKEDWGAGFARPSFGERLAFLPFFVLFVPFVV
jgi:hypothetical protein